MNSLADALELTDEQNDAVMHEGCVVVTAGPGSGKTQTLAAKAALLLNAEVVHPQRVACITYTRSAASEISDRVRSLAGRHGNFEASTLHSFCRNWILGSFAVPAGEPWLAAPPVVVGRNRERLVQQALDRYGVAKTPRQWGTTLTTIRRYIASGEDVQSRFSDDEILAAEEFDRLLVAHECVDFDAIVHHSLRFISDVKGAAAMVVAAFPWVLVDEYQDLGGPLHRIVLALKAAGARIFAVGDEDQTILQFTGADPKYLRELPDLGFFAVTLSTNHRSGLAIIRGAAAALGIDRGYVPSTKRTDDGRVVLHQVDGGLRAQIDELTEKLLPDLQKRYKTVAVLYRGTSAIVDEFRAAASACTHLDFVFERSQDLSLDDPAVAFFRACARFATRGLAEAGSDLAGASEYLRRTVFADDRLSRVDSNVQILSALDDARCRGLDGVAEWADELAQLLGLNAPPSAFADADSFEEFHRASGAWDWNLEQLAAFGEPRPGHVIVTTFHSAKGREFDAVVLPFLQDGIVPFGWKNWNGSIKLASPQSDRRTFYVAFTRAQHHVALVYSDDSRIDASGQRSSLPRSRYLSEIDLAVANV